jgi:hypothetical protein
LRDEIGKEKFIKKRSIIKQIAIIRMMIKFDIKIKRKINLSIL